MVGRSERSSRGRVVPSEQQAARDTLIAELLQLTGRDDDAIARANSVLQRKPRDLSLAARCHSALGEVDRNAGRTESAIEFHRLAVEEATAANDLKQRAWAGLRLFLTLVDGPGLETATAVLPAVRRDVARLGDAHITSALHLFVAGIEALRGLFGVATEHLRIGRSVMGGSQNCYLEALAANDACCIAFSLSDLDATRTRRGPRCASRRSLDMPPSCARR